MRSKEIEKERKIKIVDFMKSSLYVPMKEKQLAVIMQVSPQERGLFSTALRELLEDGSITVNKRGLYSIREQVEIQGTYIASSRGFGFVQVEGMDEDYFIPEGDQGGALHNDKVQILITSTPGRQTSKDRRTQARVIRVIERGTKTLVGRYEKGKNYGFVTPDNPRFTEDIFVPSERSKGAMNGHKVLVEIYQYAQPGKRAEGKVLEILGHENDPGVDILSIVKSYDLPTEFPEKVMLQAERVAEEISDSDIAFRLDIRDWLTITVDGEDAKDLDDALTLEEKEDGYYLGVHIADVTNYVQEGSALDREALTRSTSVYLTDRVIPMLPHRLSNGICSLNAGEDRLALSCIMQVNKQGKVTDYEIRESVIRVDRRMTYTAVKKILEEDGKERAAYTNLLPMLTSMKDLAQILHDKRVKRGAIDFDFPESKILLNPQGVPLEIKPYERNVATRIIEEFMLLANETVAQHFAWAELPFLYRIHDTPDADKIRKLALFIYNFGYTVKMTKDEIHPKELQKLLVSIEGSEEEAIISRLTLRSMKQAKYSVASTGHFGLACQYYSHFTSPIRRYPDLQIHRIIKEQLRGKLTQQRIEHYQAILPDVASTTSKLERRAEEAERETDKLKKVEYMESRVGEIFEGVISGVMSWGIYVELPNTIEGMVHITKITGDYYVFDEQNYELVGEKTKKTYKLGQKVQIVVGGTDRFMKTIDFVLYEE